MLHVIPSQKKRLLHQNRLYIKSKTEKPTEEKNMPILKNGNPSYSKILFKVRRYVDRKKNSFHIRYWRANAIIRL